MWLLSSALVVIFVVNNWSRDAGWPVTFWRCVPRALVRGAAWWRHFALTQVVLSGRFQIKVQDQGSRIKDLHQSFKAQGRG